MGVPFGDAWCLDASGRVFVFGNAPPGLYQLMPEGDPAPLTRHTLEETEFKDIDFSTHRMLLAWNPIDKGVHIFQVAWATSVIVSHWFFEENTGQLVKRPPLWQDTINDATKQPTCVTYLGGDDTRGLLIGCADGFVRRWDPAAVTDDGTPILSRLMFGKITPPGGPRDEYRLTETTVALADDQGGALLELFASETADTPGPPQQQTDLQPGLNEGFRKRVKGNHIHVRISNASARRWAFEAASIELEDCGKAAPPRSP
jgi:hypothetical protein